MGGGVGEGILRFLLLTNQVDVVENDTNSSCVLGS